MLIRTEQKVDFDEIRDVVKTAFETAEHTDGAEYILVDKLRKSDGFASELALVAEKNGRIIGHIMFTKVNVGDETGLALAPLSVVPSAQRKGVGTALIRKAHEVAKALGYNFSVVLGSEKYYQKFGYKTASEYGIIAPFDVPAENFMVCHFNENAEKISGEVDYVKEFFE